MNGSLFSLLVRQHQEEVVPMRCTAAMLGRLDRHFQDLVIENGLSSAIVVQGRCLNGPAELELQRFYRVSAAAQQHYVISCGPNCRRRTWAVPTFPRSQVFEQGSFHDFDSGPFVVIVDPRFSGLLASERVPDDESDGPAFRMVWSFDPNVVFTAIEYLIARVSAQHPDHGILFARQVRNNAPTAPSLRMTLNLTTRLALMLQRQTEIETAINRISGMVNGTLNPDELYQNVVDQVAKSLGVRRVALAIWDEGGTTPEAVREAIRPAREHSEPLSFFTAAPAPIEVPILARGTPIGLLTVEDDVEHRVWEDEEVMMVRTVADHLAVGISNLRLFKRLEEQAITDELTGLFNRRYFQDFLERELQIAQRNGQNVSLILLDLDYLKQVNDAHGHLVGDAVLRYIGQTLETVVRSVDVCARYGGEEFAVVLPYTDREGAALVAERLRHAINATPLDEVGFVSASFGVTTFPGTAGSVEGMTHEADQALYAAKRSGRNRVVMFSEIIHAAGANHSTGAGFSDEVWH